MSRQPISIGVCKSAVGLWVCLSCVVPAIDPAHGDDDFARYQVILSRKPFGDAPPPEIEEAAPVPQAESFAKTLRMFSIRKPEDGSIKVGMMDSATQAMIVLNVGETHPDGITLVSANFKGEEAVVQKGEEIALIKLADGGATPITQKEASAHTKLQTTPPANTTALPNYHERHEQRRLERLENARKAREARMQREQAKPKYTPEQLRAHLQEYNMEVIRKGLPALPLELTPD